MNEVSLGIAACLGRTQIRTYRAKVHEAWEEDNPGVPDIDYVTTVELKELSLDTSASKRRSNEILTRRASANQ